MKGLITALVPLAFAACTPLAPLPSEPIFIAVADAADSEVAVPSGPSVIYGGYEVADPEDWQRANDAQTGR